MGYWKDPSKTIKSLEKQPEKNLKQSGNNLHDYNVFEWNWDQGTLKDCNGNQCPVAVWDVGAFLPWGARAFSIKN